MDRRFFECALVLLLGASPSLAQSRRLNAPFPSDHIGAVQSFVLGAGRTVYAADQDVQGSLELYNAPSDGSAPSIHLAAPGVTVAAGLTMRVSPDGQWLVYQTDFFRSMFPDRLFELFSVPMNGGGSALRLSGTLVANGSVQTYAVGATHAVFLADALVDETVELFSARLDGSGSRVRLNPALVAGGDVASCELSPDGTRVVFQADDAIDNTFELFSAPADGSAPALRLHPALTAAQDAGVLGKGFSPDSSHVLFTSNLAVAGASELFSVPSDGSAPPLRLHPAFPSGRAVTAYAVCPLSQNVVYIADALTDNVFELFSVPLDGSAAPVRLNGALVSGGDLSSFEISPDGQSVTYVADALTDGRFELFGVPIDGSAPSVRLNGPLQPSTNVGTYHFGSNSTRVVYYADEEVGNGPELHSAPISSGASVRIADPTSSARLYELTIAPDGRVLYLLDTFCGEFCSTQRLFSAPIDGSAAPLELTLALNPPGGYAMGSVAIDPVGGRAVFRYFGVDSVSLMHTNELYSVPTAGSAAPVKLHPAMALGGSERDVSAFRFTRDGRWAVYTADQDQNDVIETYRTRADGAGFPVKLGPASSITLSRDSTWSVYGGVSGPIYSVRIDGSAAAVPIAPTGANSGVLISPDSSRVVYLESFPFTIHSVPIDGSASPVTLADSFVSGGSIPPHELPQNGISPDSSRLVFVADKDTDEQFELYSAPLDGSAAPVKLSGTLVAGGDVSFHFQGSLPMFQISPDSSRVVYVADANVDGRDELFSVPIDGSAPPVRLNGTLGLGGNVSSLLGNYGISPDSTRVVYRADQQANERFELFSVPLDGSSPAVKLNTTPVAGGDVEGIPTVHATALPGAPFVISPDSTRVVYRTDELVNDRFVLRSVPIDGSASPVTISGAMIPAGDVDFEQFVFTPDGTRVVFEADAEVDEVPELLVAPIDGSAAPKKLAASAAEFALRPDGSGLVYRKYLTTFPTVTLGLYSVALDGTGFADVAHVTGDTSIATSTSYAINPDSGSVVYIADRVPRTQELWLSFLARPHLNVRKP